MATLRDLLLPKPREERLFTLGDFVVFILIAVLLYAGVTLAVKAPPSVKGPAISLAPSALPGTLYSPSDGWQPLMRFP